MLLEHQGKSLHTPIVLQYLGIEEKKIGLMVMFSDGSHQKQLLMSSRWADMFRKTGPVIIHVNCLITIREVKKKGSIGIVMNLAIKQKQKRMERLGIPVSLK